MYPLPTPFTFSLAYTFLDSFKPSFAPPTFKTFLELATSSEWTAKLDKEIVQMISNLGKSHPYSVTPENLSEKIISEFNFPAGFNLENITDADYSHLICARASVWRAFNRILQSCLEFFDFRNGHPGSIVTSLCSVKKLIFKKVWSTKREMKGWRWRTDARSLKGSRSKNLIFHSDKIGFLWTNVGGYHLRRSFIWRRPCATSKYV